MKWWERLLLVCVCVALVIVLVAATPHVALADKYSPWGKVTLDLLWWMWR